MNAAFGRPSRFGGGVLDGKEKIGLKLDQAYSGNVFICSSDDYEAAKAVIYGMPMDFTVSLPSGLPVRSRPRFARLRSGWKNTALIWTAASMISSISMRGICCCRSATRRAAWISSANSCGACWRTASCRSALAASILSRWPIIHEVYKKYPDLAVIHFDAHADLREQYEGEPLSHSTPMRKAAELIGGEEHVPIRHPLRLQGGVDVRTGERATSIRSMCWSR